MGEDEWLSVGLGVSRWDCRDELSSGDFREDLKEKFADWWMDLRRESEKRFWKECRCCGAVI